jgi:hypothetical protein
MDDDGRATEQGRQRRDEVVMAGRVSRGTWVGLTLGGLLLGALGAWIGWIAFDSARAVMGMAIAGVVAGGGLGAFVGGLSRLESPDPAREPSQTDRPLREADGLTTEEDAGWQDARSPRLGTGRSADVPGGRHLER